VVCEKRGEEILRDELLCFALLHCIVLLKIRKKFPTKCEESLVSPAELIMQQHFFFKPPQIYVAKDFFLLSNKRDVSNEIKRSNCRHVIWDSTSSHTQQRSSSDDYKLARKISISLPRFSHLILRFFFIIL
jgi:hypothetical protein